jgi:hypothetical protein
LIGRASRLALAASILAGACARVEPGTLEIAIRDAASGELVPARVEVLDAAGTSHVASDALRVRGDCGGYLPEVIAAVPAGSPGIPNPNAGTLQFYSTGRAHLELEAGAYRVRVEKGPEYARAERRVKVSAGQLARVEIPLSRWIDLPGEGWYSADAHLHIARRSREDDDAILRWMQAEDLHVANLLQMGNADGIGMTPQYAHGPASVHQEGDTLLVSGQENPRTHFLGHAVVLGGRTLIHFPERYLLYQLVFQEARRQGALSGYAHLGELFGAPYGLAVDLPTGTLDFLEVQSADFGSYAVWYEALNAGFPLAAVAGSDYPCWPQLPGRARFYTRVEGPLELRSWLDGVERRRTFVSNGPILRFRVDGHDVGSRVRLPKAREVRLTGDVRFDPARVRTQLLEVVQDGEVVRSFPVDPMTGEASFDFSLAVTESAWFALRASGRRDDLDVQGGREPPARAHTSPIYVEVAGTSGAPPDASRPWLARLAELEAKLADPESLAEWPANGDGTRPEQIRRDRAALLEAIGRARAHFRGGAESPR